MQMKIKIKNGLPRLVFLGTVINNGVKIYREFVLPSKLINSLEDLILIIRSKYEKHTINHNFEAGVFLSHLRVTNPDDRILAVGLGTGSTLIPMVKFMETTGGGFYRSIEASESQIEIARKNIELNNIDCSRYEIINAYAGKDSYDIWGIGSNINLDINEYEFDVLEMDCEGSELSIIQSLKRTPRNIIVELHPGHFTSEYKDFDRFLQFMDGKGYVFQFAYGHSGDFLNINSARRYYNSTKTSGNLYDCKEDRTTHFFVVCPIVVTFRKK
jgi:hypothetical protein